MVSNEQYAKAKQTLLFYIEELNSAIELELLQNELLQIIQKINRQIIKVKELKAQCP